jgi:hypothetical protein
MIVVTVAVSNPDILRPALEVALMDFQTDYPEFSTLLLRAGPDFGLSVQPEFVSERLFNTFLKLENHVRCQIANFDDLHEDLDVDKLVSPSVLHETQQLLNNLLNRISIQILESEPITMVEAFTIVEEAGQRIRERAPNNDEFKIFESIEPKTEPKSELETKPETDKETDQESELETDQDSICRPS